MLFYFTHTMKAGARKQGLEHNNKTQVGGGNLNISINYASIVDARVYGIQNNCPVILSGEFGYVHTLPTSKVFSATSGQGHTPLGDDT